MATRPAGRGRRADETTAALRREIKGGRFQSAEALPGERQLAQWFHVSRATLRQALAELIADGLLVQRQGMGTFIVRDHDGAGRPDETRNGPMVGIGLNGPIHRSVTIDQGICGSTADEAMLLGMAPDETVFRRTRLIFSEAGPLAIERAALASSMAPDPRSPEATLLDLLARHGARPRRKLQRLRAAALDMADALRLEIAPQALAIELHEALFVESGACCAVTRALYRADRLDAVFAVDLHPSG